ncbi:Ribosomal-protein-S18p-alanine acetyltransferase [Marinobacterium lacunae]|uniref:[Ribosomal protein bS18]-alanine N-acetyltransferase n=1 Tax=Marinobacterium lacunae TaxID=1232683 RepID=A0A081G0V1_9GAMM|nr:ribosomal protein S18-alanine N-acetyltransferase [Marinobacterium lacunae]KEA64406.1 Ribosomal-protein-S18p-alanine acetyltransferase [Marinobacterium lacunae]MBR9882348.1 ribosomal protein S18-alanine N-acetyltransferase [Oceanospirillales bacterium]
MNTPLFRRATADDLNLLLALDDSCFDDPWSAKLWQQMLTNSKRYVCWLLLGERPMGFILFSHVLDEAELMRIGVHPQVRNEGHARAMLTQAQGVLEQRGVGAFYLEVRDSNSAAQHLYHSCGWRLDGRRRNYYPTEDGTEDALLFNRVLD